ncbi:MAG TPA: DUF3182 family protein [Burkholderiales bacterium]|nr:DUF3182 family protein [Burkholderiales bacterium]
MANIQALRRNSAARLNAPRGALRTHGVVVSFPRGMHEDPDSHEAMTRSGLARRLAALKGYEYAGDFNASGEYDCPVYVVPGDTLVGAQSAKALGINGADDFFGGVVPFHFVGTKTITHPLIEANAHAPEGWSGAFARGVRRAVLPGYSAFSLEDARQAGERLLQSAAVRVKPALALGGRGQSVVSDAGALAQALRDLDTGELESCGVVLEQNLSDVTTFSVGQVCVGDLVASYFGTQKLATDHTGAEVYGGSDLTVVRGDFNALLALDTDDAMRLAVEQARTYDAAARRCFTGFFASRRNYDIVRGRGPDGAMKSGVLEQSWRIGGASGAEIAALEAFRADPDLGAVRAECTETYDEHPRLPRNARVTYSGRDAEIGYITKYTTLAAHADA